MAFGLRRATVLGYLSVQLVSEISNLCDHNPPTSHTDGQTDDMRSQYRALHYSASRGKNCMSLFMQGRELSLSLQWKGLNDGGPIVAAVSYINKRAFHSFTRRRSHVVVAATTTSYNDIPTTVCCLTIIDQ